MLPEGWSTWAERRVLVSAGSDAQILCDARVSSSPVLEMPPPPPSSSSDPPGQTRPKARTAMSARATLWSFCSRTCARPARPPERVWIALGAHELAFRMSGRSTPTVRLLSLCFHVRSPTGITGNRTVSSLLVSPSWCALCCGVVCERAWGRVVVVRSSCLGLSRRRRTRRIWMEIRGLAYTRAKDSRRTRACRRRSSSDSGGPSMACRPLVFGFTRTT